MYDLSEICSLCLIRSQNLTSIISQHTDDNGTVVEILKIILLELIDLKPNIPKYICKSCIDILNYIHRFRLKCLKNITILEQYIQELLEGSKNGSVPELLSTNVKEELLQLENLNDNKTCETELQNDCHEENIALESVFIKDEIDGPNIFLNETNIQENNELISQDVIKLEIEDTRISISENIVEQEHEDDFDNVQAPYEIFTEFNEEKHIIEENEDVTSNDIFSPNEDITNDCNKTKQYKCKICSKTFLTPKNLRRHNSFHTNERPFECSICRSRFKLRQHLKTHQSGKSSCKPFPARFECSECNRVFTQVKGLHAHMRSHSNERLYRPTIYPKLINAPPNENTSKICSRTKRHQCNICQKFFINPKDLERHGRVHTNERPYQCPDCPKSFKLRQHLKEHSATHTGNHPHMCDLCSKTFFYKSHLIRHVEVVHNKIRKYKCTECTKTFTKSSDLKAHLRIHTGERPYKCNTCDKTFTLAHNLTKHSRKHEKLSKKLDA